MGFWLISQPWKFSPCGGRRGGWKRVAHGEGSSDAWGHINYIVTSRRPTILDITVSASLRLCPDCAPTPSPFPRIATVSPSLCLLLSLPHFLTVYLIFVMRCSDVGNFKHAGTTFAMIKEDRFCLTPDSATGSLINNSWYKGKRARSHGSSRIRFTGSSCRTSDNCLPLHAPKNKTDRCRVVGNFKHARLTLPQLRSERSKRHNFGRSPGQCAPGIQVTWSCYVGQIFKSEEWHVIRRHVASAMLLNENNCEK